MSLRVWLPLTKDLRNQGLDDVTVTNNGATFNSAGKLGGCYSFGNGSASSNGLFLNSNLVDLMQEEYSVAVWVKPLGNHYHYNGTIFSSGDWNHTCYAFGLSQDNSQVDVLCRGYNTYMTCAVPVNTWTHLVCTCDSDNVVHLYKNAEHIGSFARSSKPASDNTTQACIGRETYASGYFTFNGMLNDFRLYDHCLSPMEVKQLSQGLVLHYPLNRGGWGQENLAVDTATVSSINGKVYSLASTIPSGTKVTISCWIDADNVTMSGAKRIGLSSGISRSDGTGTQWFETWISYSNGLLSDNGSFHGRISNTQTILGDMTIIGAYIQTLSSGTVSISQLKVEIGDEPTPWCPNSSDTLAIAMGLNSTTEYDCSGFCNNGIKNNSPTYSSDTAKHAISTHLDGVNQTIQIPNLSTLIHDDIYTFNIWFKRLSTEPSPKPWETILGGPSGFEIETCSANNVHDNKIKAYSWGSGTFEFELDKWNMLTLVRTASDSKFYLNGELKLTGTRGAIPSGNYFLGSWRDTSTQNYKGYLSDARIYVTALSADDVKNLYQNSAYISSNGINYAYDFVEE